MTTIRDTLVERDQRYDADRSLYHETPAGPLWSAAAIAERAVPHDRLLTWMAWRTVILAHEHRDELDQLGAAAPAWLHARVMDDRDSAGLVGRAVHHALNADILDAPHPIPTDQQTPFIRAYQQFVEDHAPSWSAAAMTVAHVDGVDGARWAGVADFFAEIDGRQVVGDFTTARRLDVAALKIIGLSMCETGWLPNGEEVEPPELDGAVIVHLRPDLYPDTGYRLVPVELSDWAATAFEAAALMVHHYHDSRGVLFTAPTQGDQS